MLWEIGPGGLQDYDEMIQKYDQFAGAYALGVV